MAELLLQLVDQTNPEPARDLLDSFKRGMTILIKPDGGPWGRMESIEVWVADGNDPDDWHRQTAIIKIPAASEEDVSYLLESASSVIDEQLVTTRRRSWRSNLDALPVPVRNTIDRDFVYTTTKMQWDAIAEYLGL